MIVLDASMAGPLTIPDEHDSLSHEAKSVLGRDGIVVPAHWHIEVANMLRTAVRRGRLTPRLRNDALERLSRFDIEVDRDSAQAAWTTALPIADRFDLTPYDAAYVELALRRGSPLATRDRAMIAAARSLDVAVETFAP